MQIYNNINTNNNPHMTTSPIMQLSGLLNINSISQLQQPKSQEIKKPGSFVRPKITSTDFSKTMENFRVYKHNYNAKCDLSNEKTLIYNNRIKKHLKGKDLTPLEINTVKQFEALHLKDNAWEYNNAAREFNKVVKGNSFVKLKKIQTLKIASENIFQNILWHYDMQLQKRNNQHAAHSICYPSFLPHIEVHTGWITNKEIEGVLRCPVSQKTFRTHRKRLEEAGVLKHYRFEGTRRPVKLLINTQILSITDQFLNPQAKIDNQLVTDKKRKMLPHNNVSNTQINNYKIKGNVDNQHSENKRSSGRAFTAFNSCSTGTQGSIVSNPQTQSKENVSQAKKNSTPGVKIPSSSLLRAQIQDNYQLAGRLAAGDYDNYKRIGLEVLQKEAFHGTLTRAEYRILVIQDFMKSLAKFYKGKGANAGTWNNAIKIYLDNKFLTIDRSNAANKHNIYSKMGELRWRIDYVARYLARNEEFNLLFPSQYLDSDRNTKISGGFEYTHKAWRKSLKDHERHQQKRQKKRAEIARKARKHSELQKVEKHIYSFLDKKFSFDELCTKVSQIGNKELYNNLPNMIEEAVIVWNNKKSK